jgi:hypothetical protein
MNKNSYLYRSLRLPVLLSIVTLAIAYWSYEFIEQAKYELDGRYDKQLKETDALNYEVSQLQQRVGLVNSYYGRFQNAYASGVFEAQSRVNWIDHFMILVKRYDIRKVSLDFAARSSLLESELRFLSPMKNLIKQEWVEFEGEFQHEGDWLDFMRDLKLSVNEYMLLKNCRLMSLQNREAGPLSERDLHFSWEGGNVAVKCKFRFLVFEIPEVNATTGKKP